jgi:hypothetical protein
MADESSDRGGDGSGPKPSGREAPVAQKSGPAAPPVIAVRMETLLAWVVERVAKFPREHKFTVGDRLVETCLDITSHLVEASYRRDKHAELTAASRALVRARVLFRLARTVHCVSEAQHHYFAKARRLREEQMIDGSEHQIGPDLRGQVLDRQPVWADCAANERSIAGRVASMSRRLRRSPEMTQVCSSEMTH